MMGEDTNVRLELCDYAAREGCRLALQPSDQRRRLELRVGAPITRSLKNHPSPLVLGCVSGRAQLAGDFRLSLLRCPIKRYR